MAVAARDPNLPDFFRKGANIRIHGPRNEQYWMHYVKNGYQYYVWIPLSGEFPPT